MSPKFIVVPLLATLLTLMSCTTSPSSSGKDANQINIKIKRAWAELLSQEAPESYPTDVTPHPPRNGVRGIFFESVPYKGKETRVFAWYGVPESKNREKVPAMVLIHGGNETANARWVKTWMKRGYAAIAMDNRGTTPSYRGRRIVTQRHDHSGPTPREGGDFQNIDDHFRDQWVFHAVSAAILAHNFIRSQPGVDAGKTGITGVSWGGFIALNTAAADPRFKLCIPIYGCGFIGDESIWAKKIARLGESGKKWLRMWDPSNYLRDVSMPTLWISGADDSFYPPSSRQKSYRLLRTKPVICLKPRMVHGLLNGFSAKESYTFANAILKNGTPLPEITGLGRQDRSAWVTFKSTLPINNVLLVFTKDTGPWEKRKWEILPARLDSLENKATGEIPGDASVYYFNIRSQRNRIVSSPHVELK